MSGSATAETTRIVDFPVQAGARPRPAPSSQTGSDINLGRLMDIIRRRLYLAIGSFLITATMVALISLRATPLYTSSGSVLIDPRKKEVIDFQSVLSGLTPDSTIVDTEVKLIRSRTIVSKVIADLNLDKDPEFNPFLREKGALAQILSAISTGFADLAPAQVKKARTGDDDDIARQLEYEKTVSEVGRKLTVSREGLTYIITISFKSEDPAKATRIARSFAEQYLTGQLDAKFDATSRANEWLNERLAILRTEVRKAEDLVEAFRTRSGLLSSEGVSLTEQQISDLNAQFIVQDARLDEARARLSSVVERLARGDDPETISEVLNSPVVGDLRRQQAEVSRRYGELSTRYGPEHPEILRIARETKDLQTQVDREVLRIRTNLEAEVGVEDQKAKALKRSLGAMRRELATNNKSLVRLRELERDAEANRVLYENFLNRSKQTGEQGSLTEADARIISAAAIPTRKSYPNTGISLALAVWIGLAIAAFVVFLAEALDRGIANGSEIETELQLPHIGSVPQLPAGKGRNGSNPAELIAPSDYLVDKPVSAFAEVFRTIRSSVTLSNLDTPPKVIAITSVAPGEGKTTISHCLGRISAMSGDRTVVVDCDLRRRSLSRMILNEETDHGLLEILSGSSSLDDALVRDSRTSLDVLPLSASSFTPQDTFRSDAFRGLLHSLSQTYDLVILDTAPLPAVAEVRTLAYLSDAVILAVKWRKTSVQAARMATAILDSVHARTAGAVLSRIDPDTGGKFGSYGYGNYGYSSGYARYYS